MLTQASNGGQSVVRPNSSIAHGTADAFIEIGDIQALVAELGERGANITLQPTYRPIYNGWEMGVRDRDGRTILFTQVD